ncbi:unnamed protein product [Symbiodinium necroappetens]|uniref:Uncharacterized protein n=1 Tax=Symbiodinium necroappetens TaxID=1628268 RepID=A0A812PIL7_9DINO|nr:unnamed protein product [Symbiodinium necroappetens]
MSKRGNGAGCTDASTNTTAAADFLAKAKQRTALLKATKRQAPATPADASKANNESKKSPPTSTPAPSRADSGVSLSVKSTPVKSPDMKKSRVSVPEPKRRVSGKSPAPPVQSDNRIARKPHIPGTPERVPRRSWSYADTGSQPPPCGTPSSRCKGTPAKSPEPMSVEKLHDAAEYGTQPWQEPWSWSGWSDASWGWGSSSWWKHDYGYGYGMAAAWYSGGDTWGRGWSHDSQTSEPGPSEEFDPANLKELLRRPVTTEEELDKEAENIQPDECKKDLDKELRNLDTQSTLPLPGGRTQSTLELDKDPSDPAATPDEQATIPLQTQQQWESLATIAETQSLETQQAAIPVETQQVQPSIPLETQQQGLQAGIPVETQGLQAAIPVETRVQAAIPMETQVQAAIPQQRVQAADPPKQQMDSVVRELEYHLNNAATPQKSMKPPPSATKGASPCKPSPVGSEDAWRLDKHGQVLSPAALFSRFYRSIRSPKAPDAVKEEFKKADNSSNRTQKFHDMYLQFISAKGNWSDSTIVLRARKSHKEVKDVVYLFKTYRDLVQELGQDMADDLAKRAREADPTFSGKSCRLHPQFPKREDMQLFKSFAYIQDKKRDEKETSAEVDMRAENVDEDDMMNAMEDALPSDDGGLDDGDKPLPKPKEKIKQPKKEKTWRDKGAAADKKANQDLVEYQGFAKALDDVKMAPNMKKAILADIVPAANDLRKCKDVVARGIGTKMSEVEMKPLVEALLAALDDVKTVSEPVRSAERKSSKEAKPKTSAKKAAKKKEQ